MSEPCRRCEGYDGAIQSFVSSNSDFVETTAKLKRITAQLDAVRALCQWAERMGQSTIPLADLNVAMGRPSGLREECDRWQGLESRYQNEAHKALHDAGIKPAHYSWINPRCGTQMCLQPDHLLIHAPDHIEYPYGVCVYCGRPADTKDHLIPRPVSGDTMRRFIATVPACRQCNTLLSATLTASITERRQEAHARLRRHHRKVLRTRTFTTEELSEFGPMLRADIVSSVALKAEILTLFDWPTDPNYDLRAFQKSGIDDPYAAGFLHAIEVKR